MLSDSLKAQIRQCLTQTKARMPGFIVRHAQNKMIAEIGKTLGGDYQDSNQILCVEAPTGTGKTFAYLASGIPIAKERDKKLIVSSANVALQEQLINKDISDVKRYSGLDFTHTLVKGRSRYVCVRNLINLVEDQAQTNPLFESTTLWDNPPEKAQLQQLSELLEQYSDNSWSGEIDDLDTQPESSLWQKISCNRFTCTAKSCDLYNDCAFFKARKQINKADVIVANHDLVLADLSTGNTVLPSVDESIFIFDEAHHLGDKALSHFAKSLSLDGIKTQVRQTLGTLAEVEKITGQERVEIDVETIDQYVADLQTLLAQLDYEEDIHLFDQGVLDSEVAKLCSNLSQSLQQVFNQFEQGKQQFSDYLKIQLVDKAVADLLINALGECEMHLLGSIECFLSLLETDTKTQAPHSRWIEQHPQNPKKPNYILHSAKIDISHDLDQLIWSKAAGAILTSATLSSLGSFDRLNQQLGLVKAQNQYLRLPSPFDFSQVDFVIAKLKHNPTQVFEHTQEIATEILKRIDPKAGSLVLFASNRQMQAVADLVENQLDCQLWVQGEFSKKLILEKHAQEISQGRGSVIFGLDSFAEGVDLRGEFLTHVLIAKLRFSVPTSPIEKTLSDYLVSQSRNPFNEIALPDASLRLIQACGRLIRTETDSGKITIFDNRLVSKYYGKQLLAALPEYRVVVE